jgi:sugar lactone lactonase YvrE
VVGDSPGLARVVAGVAGDSGRGAAEGDARTEPLLAPNGVAAAGGTLYIADTGNRVVREVSLIGTERIVAGDPYCGAPVIATVAARALCFRRPTAVAILSPGVILVADAGADVVWAVDIPADTAAPFLGTGIAGAESTLAQPARSQRTWEPTDVAVGPDGTVYVVETGNARLVAVSVPLGGTVPVSRLVAGRTASAGYSGDGGFATGARLRAPRGVAVSGGELYIADTFNNVVRRIDQNGRISTFAGTGRAGFAGDDGPATSALLNQPARVVVAGDLLFISDRGNRRVRVVALGTGRIATFLGNGDSTVTADLVDAGATATRTPEGLAASEGFLYAADAGHHVVRRILVP